MTSPSIEAMQREAMNFTPLTPFQVWQKRGSHASINSIDNLCLSHEHLRQKLEQSERELAELKIKFDCVKCSHEKHSTLSTSGPNGPFYRVCNKCGRSF